MTDLLQFRERATAEAYSETFVRFDYAKLKDNRYAVFAIHLEGRHVELVQFNGLASAAHAATELNKTYRDQVKILRVAESYGPEQQYRWHIKVGHTVQEQEILMDAGYEPWAVVEEAVYFKKRMRVK